MNAPHHPTYFAKQGLTVKAGSETAADAVTLRDLLRFARKSARFVALWTLGLVGLAVAYVVVTPPSYTASASLIIDPNKARSLLQDSVGREFVVDPALIDSQVEVLKSDRIAGLVVRSLDLVKDPEFVSPEGPSAIASLIGSVKEAFGLAYPPPATPELSRETREAILKLGDKLYVNRVGQSYVLDVSFTSRDPEKAAKIANEVVQAYIDEELAANADAARRGGDWLQARLTELREQTLQAAREAARFKALGGGAAAGGGSASANDAQVQLAQLDSVAQTYRRIYEALLQRLTETVQKQSYPVADARVIATATVPADASQPKSKLIVAFAAAFGLLSGAAIMGLRTTLDRRIRDGSRIRALDVAYLGPVKRRDDASVRRRDRDAASLNEEDLRAVRVMIAAGVGPRRALTIGVMGLERNGDLNPLILGVAQSFAAGGGQTLIVDANLAPRGLTGACALDGAPGLHQCRGDQDPAAFAHGVGPDLKLLPVGVRDGAAGPGDILSGERGAARIDALRRQFETIVVALPPLAFSGDARAIGPLLDGVAVVVDAAGDTTIDALQNVLSIIRLSGASPVGVVVNRVPARRVADWI